MDISLFIKIKKILINDGKSYVIDLSNHWEGQIKLSIEDDFKLLGISDDVHLDVSKFFPKFSGEIWVYEIKNNVQCPSLLNLKEVAH